MWWALGLIGVLAVVNAVLGWRRPVNYDGWFWSGSDDGWDGGLFDYFSSDSGD